MDWFEQLTGFRERSYADTKAQLEVKGSVLTSKVNGKSYAIGDLEVVSLAELRSRVAQLGPTRGKLRFSNVQGDVRKLHHAPENAGVLFQVASQFNMLEMVGPNVTPEEGVTRYQHDHTQGPACAIAAGAATLYRNYFAPIGDQVGQTKDRQLDGLADLGDALARRIGPPVVSLYAMRNGYALATRDGLTAIAELLGQLHEPDLDDLRGLLRIGVHRDVELTDGGSSGQRVSQAFCSALPVAYSGLPQSAWAPFASLVLEAAYEATILQGALNSARGGSNIVNLTRLGGGAFGNADAWIDAAMTRALRLSASHDLDVRLVSYGSVPPSMIKLAGAFA